MIGTISAADFILALKRYRDEVGAPVLSAPLAGENAEARTTEERKPSRIASSESPAKRTNTGQRKADQLKEKELQQKAKERQSSLF